MSLGHIESMTLSIKDLQKMKSEFHEAYQSMFQNAFHRLKRAIKLKVHAIKLCSRGKEASSSDFSINDASEFNFKDYESPKNLTKKITLSRKDREDIRKEELNF